MLLTPVHPYTYVGETSEPKTIAVFGSQTVAEPTLGKALPSKKNFFTIIYKNTEKYRQ